jgi:hypothetical protein
MVAVERPRDMDVLQDLVRIEIQRLHHLPNPLRAERLFRINPNGVPTQAPILLWPRDVHGELMRKLALSAAKFAIALRDRLCLQSAAQQFIQGL